MKKVFAVLVLVALTMIATNTAFSQKGTIKIGVVDVEAIVKEIPEAADADKKLQEMNVTFRDSLSAMEKTFVEKAEQYQKQKAMMTPDQQKKEEESLQKIQIEYQKFQQEKFGTQGELAQMREVLLAPIREKVRKAIQKVAKEEQMSFVLDKANPILLYSEDKYDITFKVLDTLKRGEG